MKRVSTYGWLEEMSEIEGGAFSDVADQIEASSSSLQTYHAVLGFLPKPFEAKSAHPTNPVECCADANPKTMLPNDT